MLKYELLLLVGEVFFHVCLGHGAAVQVVSEAAVEHQVNQIVKVAGTGSNLPKNIPEWNCWLVSKKKLHLLRFKSKSTGNDMLPPPPHNKIFMMGKKYPFNFGSYFC